MTKPHPWRRWFRKTYGFTPEKWERERFMRNLTITGACWLWTGPARYNIDGKLYDPIKMAHVFFRGPVPKGYQVSTTCGHTCCMKAHLQCFTGTGTGTSFHLRPTAPKQAPAGVTKPLA